jgi:class 3 adenylate cyclase/tetratricopeptide (TPR) repeat protein
VTFCGGCGASFAKRCARCGTDNPQGFKFCGTCGRPLGDDAPTPHHDVRSDDRDDAERRQLTVLFCDLVDSTSLSERLDPEDLRDIVRRYQQVVSDVVAAFGGYVAQYLGDGILVYFGFPFAQEHDAQRAALASLDIIEAIARLDAQLDIPLKVRIGLHTGPVVAGEVGARGRTERLALGPTPNVAARVQSHAAPGEILVTQDTQTLIGDVVSAVRIGPREFHGISKAITLYRLEPSKPEDQDVQAREHGPFVGRDRELQTLIELLARAQATHGQIVLLKGEAGIGKSRLHQELRRRTSDEDVAWLICRCSPFRQTSALHPIIDLLVRSLHLEEGLGGEVLRPRLAQALANLRIQSEEAFALLGDLLSMGKSDPILATMSPDRRRRKTLELLVELLLRLARPRTTVLLVEDLHWADPSTLAVLELFAEQIAEKRVLGIFTHRPTFVEPWGPHAHQTTIELRRLSDRDVVTMIDNWMAGRLPAAIRDAVVARADGVPLFVQEMTRTLLDWQRDHPADAKVNGTGVPERLIPNTLRDLLMARLDAVGSAKDTAQLGAVLGRRFSFEELAAVGELGAAALEEQLDRLVDARILTRAGKPPEATYSFAHALIRDAAYDSMLRRRRMTLHDRAARVLEAANAQVLDPQRLARHHEAAGHFEQASDLYARAATQANANWAYAEAIANLKQSLELLSRTPESSDRDRAEFRLLRTLSAPMQARYGYTSSALLDVYGRMRRLADRLGSEVHAEGVLLNFWAFYCARADRVEAVQLAWEVREHADESGDPEVRAVAGFVRGATSYYMGDRTSALPQLTRAVQYLQRLRDTPRPLVGAGQRLFLAWLVRSVALCDAGHIDEGRTSIAEAIAFSEAQGGPFELLQALDYRIWVALNLGEDLEKIAAIAERAERLRAEYDIGWWNSAAIWIGAVRAARGDRSAIVDMRRTVDATRAQSSGNRLNLELVVLARAQMTLGCLDEARVCLDEALGLCETTLAGFPESEICCLQGEIAWRGGDLTTADALFDRAMAVATEQGAPLFELRAAVTSARLQRGHQRFVEGRARLRALLAKFHDGFDTPYLAEARALLEAEPSSRGRSA